MGTPEWAQNLILDALIFLKFSDLPDIRWRHSKRLDSSGLCYPDHISIMAGRDRVDLKLVILHELAHWVLPTRASHEGHTKRFWDLAWQLYRAFDLPIRYCKKREGEFRKGALVAYHRKRKGQGSGTKERRRRVVKQVSYWDGKVALICSYCKHYCAFSSVDGLRLHIEAWHGVENGKTCGEGDQEWQTAKA